MSAPAIRYDDEFQRQTADLEFTPDFNAALEAIINDRLATIGERYLAWIKRNSWGRGSFYVVKPDGSPAWQRDAVEALQTTKQRISDATSYFIKRGYLLDELKLLYPAVSPVLGPSPEKVREVPDFFTTFVEEWKVTHAPDFLEFEKAGETIEKARSIRKKIRQVMLSDFKPWRKVRLAVVNVTEGADESRPAVTRCTLPTDTDIEVGRYVQESGEALPTYLPTEPKPDAEPKTVSVEAQILALPGVHAVAKKLNTTLRQPLLGQIAEILGQTPPSWLNRRILIRFSIITSFGALVAFARDVATAWSAAQTPEIGERSNGNEAAETNQYVAGIRAGWSSYTDEEKEWFRKNYPDVNWD